MGVVDCGLVLLGEVVGGGVLLDELVGEGDDETLESDGLLDADDEGLVDDIDMELDDVEERLAEGREVAEIEVGEAVLLTETLLVLLSEVGGTADSLREVSDVDETWLKLDAEVEFEEIKLINNIEDSQKEKIKKRERKKEK